MLLPFLVNLHLLHCSHSPLEAFKILFFLAFHP